MAKTEIQAASKIGARSRTSPTRTPDRYAAPRSPKTRALPSANVSVRTPRDRRSALTPSNLFGVSLKIRKLLRCSSESGVYRPQRRCGLSVAVERVLGHGRPGALPAEGVDAAVASEVAVADHLQPRAAVGCALRTVGGIAIVGLVQVHLPGRDVAEGRVAGVAENRQPVDPIALLKPAMETFQVRREARVLAVTGPDRNEDPVIRVAFVAAGEGHLAAIERRVDVVSPVQEEVHGELVVGVVPRRAPAHPNVAVGVFTPIIRLTYARVASGDPVVRVAVGIPALLRLDEEVGVRPPAPFPDPHLGPGGGREGRLLLARLPLERGEFRVTRLVESLRCVGVRQPEGTNRSRRGFEAQGREQLLTVRAQPFAVHVDLVHPAVHRRVHLGRGRAARDGPDRHAPVPLLGDAHLLALYREVGIGGELLPDRRLDLPGPEAVSQRDAHRRSPAVVVRRTRIRLPQREAVGADVSVLLALDEPVLGIGDRGPDHVALRPRGRGLVRPNLPGSEKHQASEHQRRRSETDPRRFRQRMPPHGGDSTLLRAPVSPSARETGSSSASGGRPLLMVPYSSLQTDDDGGRHPEQGQLARCQDTSRTVPPDQPIRDVGLQPEHEEQYEHRCQPPDQAVGAVDDGPEYCISDEKGPERDRVPQPEPDSARGPEPQRQAVPGRPPQRAFAYPALGRLAIELQGLDTAPQRLEAAQGDGRDREDASRSKTKVEGKEATYGTEDRARDETGECRRERVDGRLADPTPACPVPIHVGTRDPVDRVRTSRERLLGDRRPRRGEDEQREDPARPLRAECGRPDEGTEPGGGEQRRLRQHTLPTNPRHMQR